MDILKVLRRNRMGVIATCGLLMAAGCGVSVGGADQCISNADCDNDLFCDGEEYCSIDENDVARCFSRTNPCTANPLGCNEATDMCEP